MFDNILKFFGLVSYSKYQKELSDTKKKSYNEGYASAEINANRFINLPKQAEPFVIETVASECIKFYTKYGLKRLYLIGSRAKGTASVNSDHDFLVVIGDDAPEEIVSDNGAYQSLIVAQIRNAVMDVPKSPDLVICRESSFLARRNNPNQGFPYEADKYGWPIFLDIN